MELLLLILRTKVKIFNIVLNFKKKTLYCRGKLKPKTKFV